MPSGSARALALLNAIPVSGNPPQDGENRKRLVGDQTCTRRREHGDQRTRQACRWNDISLCRIAGFTSILDNKARSELKLFHCVWGVCADASCRSSAADTSSNFRNWSEAEPQRMANFRVDNKKPRFNLATPHRLARQEAKVATSGGAALLAVRKCTKNGAVAPVSDTHMGKYRRMD